jgi:polar amino acid transport system substrate-binding protein
MVTRRALLRRLAVLAVGTMVAAASPGTARADQLDDIMAAGTIRISTDFAIPPAGTMSDTMQPTGSDVETAQLLAKDWGLKLEWVSTTGSTRIPNLLTGKADIIISTLSVTPERGKVIDFSRAYTVLQSIVGGTAAQTVTDVAGLRGKTVGVTRGTTQDNRLSPLAGPNGFVLHRYEDDSMMVTAAATGQESLVATSVALVDAIKQKVPQAGYEPKFVLDNFDIAVGIRKGQPRLQAKLNEWVLANLQNGKLNAIYKKFYGNDLPAAMRPPEVH